MNDFNVSDYNPGNLWQFHDMLLTCYPDFYNRNIAPLSEVPHVQDIILEQYQARYLNGELNLSGE